jgi:RNA ligase (TIGR02306 family)
MSKFNVPVMRIDLIEPHLNADKLELIAIGGYRAVAQKGIHSVGDTIVYVPEDAVFTDLEIADQLKVRDYLVGKEKNRVKAIKLRGQLSQGIVLPARAVQELPAFLSNLGNPWPLQLGEDLAPYLKIEKYEEPIPLHMEGVVRSWPSFLPHYDIENVKRPEFLSVIEEGEEVVITEKVHGACVTVGWGPGLEEGEPAYVCSKNLALKDAEANTYWVTARKYDLVNKLLEMRDVMNHARRDSGRPEIQNISIHGEVLGVQDLKYGFNAGNPGFAAFDIRLDYEYLAFEDFEKWCGVMGIPTVPVLYQGAFYYHMLEQICEMDSAIPYDRKIREGVVVKPVRERRHDESGLGRVVLKYVGSRYLLRKGGSELH